MIRRFLIGLIALSTCGIELAHATSPPARPLAGLDSPAHINCARQAAGAFSVPFAAVLILLDVERGWSGAEQPNRNAAGEVVSYDLGPMQINDRAWLSTFTQAGITREQLRDDECVNIHAGTWILGRHLNDIRKEHAALTAEERASRDPIEVEALLRYHSRTPKYQLRYLEHIRKSVDRGLRAIAQQ